MPQDNHGLADAGDMECHPLGVVFVLHSQVNDLGYVSGFIGGAIYDVDLDYSR